MKRKLPALALALLLTFALALPVRADVMWEPIGDSFYEDHHEQCQYVDRSYLANGPQGYVTLRRSPQSAEEVYNVPNSSPLYVGYRWTAADNTEWCVCEYAIQNGDGWDWKEGWAPLTELSLIYDYLCFAEDHEAEFKDYDGSGDALTEVCLYSYPGGVFKDTLTEEREYQPFSEAFQNLYTDEAGRRWSFLGYYMGRQNAWACLDDPLNEELGVAEVQSAAAVRGELDCVVIPPPEEVPAAKEFPLWLLPAGLTAAAAVVTALLIRRRP